MNDKMEILFKEYEKLNNLFIIAASDYKQQIKHLNFYITAIAAIGVYIFSTDKIKLGSDSTKYEYIFLIPLVASIFICFYLLINILDSLYHCYLMECRISSIEQIINKEYGEDLLIYESKIISHFHDMKFKGQGTWINPGFLIGGAVGCLLFIILFYHCFLFYAVININTKPTIVYSILFGAYCVISTIVCGFISYQYYLLNTKGIAYMKSKVNEVSGLASDMKLKEAGTTKKNFKIVAIITFFAGFCVFVIMSIRNDVFWFTSKYDLPLIGNFSIMLGDSILLPLINYKIFSLLFNHFKINLFKTYSTKLFFFAIFALIINIPINIFTHNVWATDSYSDFVALQKGSLTFAGKYHLIFSIIQMSILIVFLYLWKLSYSLKDEGAIKYAHRIGIFIFMFSLLSIFDFGFKFFYIHDKDFLTEISGNYMGFVTPIISLVLLVISSYYKKKFSRK